MPQINRIRVNNVKYNFGTQFYDDFMMRFSCKNTIYDLANGGGKSVLMLLLMQNMIPNCTLDDKQPVEKLFRTGSGSSTIHSLIEWKLSEVHIKDHFKYMLTGFCARKARDEEKEENGNASIDYFNYVIFYRDYNDNDIKNLPLTVQDKKNPKRRERITYQGLKNYLRDLEKKDYNLQVKIFERKGDYQRFIAQYGIYESEWEIIRGINKTEGHVRTYFETNYKTTRKVVEDLLIEEIIEKAFKTRMLTTDHEEKTENMMVETLIGIKDKLLELAAKKDDMKNYDRQMDLIESFCGRVNGMKTLYFGQEQFERELVAGMRAIAGKLKQEEEKRLQKQERIEKLKAEKIVQQRGIDFAAVKELQIQAEAVNDKLCELQEQCGKAEKIRDELKKDLIFAEGMNDYLDYLYYKKESESVRTVIARMNEDKAGLWTELAALAAAQKKRVDKRLAELETLYREETGKSGTHAESGKELEKLKEETVNQLAIHEFRAKELEEEIDSENENIARWKRSVDLLMVYQLDREVTAAKKELLENEKQQQEMMQRLAQNKQEQGAKENAVSVFEKEQEECEKLLEENITRRMELSDDKEKLEKLKTVYREKDSEKLADFLEGKFAEAEEQARNLIREQKKLQEQMQALKKGCPVVVPEQAEAVLDYLRRYHDEEAVSGIDYLEAYPAEQKRSLIERAPYLPYGIVIRNHYEQIRNDEKIGQLVNDNVIVPLIFEKALESGEYLTREEVSYAKYPNDLFYEEEAQKRCIQKVDGELDRIGEELRRIEEKKDVYRDDLKEIREFLGGKEERLAEAEGEYETLRQTYKERESLIRREKQDVELKIQEFRDMETEKAELSEAREGLQVRIQIIEKIMESEQRVKKLESELQEHRQKGRMQRQNLQNYSGRLEAWRAKVKADEDRLSKIRKQQSDMKEMWEKYRKYVSDAAVDATYDELSDSQLESRLSGVAMAYEGDNSDVADKQKLLDNYEIAMEKSLQSIDYKGISQEVVEQAYLAGEGFETSREELIGKRRKIEEAGRECEMLQQECGKRRSEKDRLDGAMAHGREAMNQKYGFFEEMDLGGKSPEAYKNERQEMLDRLDREEKELLQQSKENEKEFRKWELLHHDLRKIVTEEMEAAYSDAGYEGASDLRERIEKAMAEYTNFQKDLEDRRNLFDQEKDMLVQTLRLMNCEALGEEIRANAVMPKNLGETEALMKGLREISECLRLEKDRICGSIENMEMIKENFESQCIQSCVNIRTELEKLSKLSKIVMDGENIPIISLQIPYVKEETYREKMAAYIDETVAEADRISGEAERVRYMKSRLSWKHLFAVIVTDMNGIRLNLYKRERMKEQSRYLRYEEAVGSTGQSQGIYIQFLIGIINYISCMYSRDTDSTSLLKTIFIDNPFGAAKDIYIWEPIFKMLKTNNVQLIVPCRGATPAITGRFDVNCSRAEITGRKAADGCDGLFQQCGQFPAGLQHDDV